MSLGPTNVILHHTEPAEICDPILKGAAPEIYQNSVSGNYIVPQTEWNMYKTDRLEDEKEV